MPHRDAKRVVRTPSSTASTTTTSLSPRSSSEAHSNVNPLCATAARTTRTRLCTARAPGRMWVNVSSSECPRAQPSCAMPLALTSCSPPRPRAWTRRGAARCWSAPCAPCCARTESHLWMSSATSCEGVQTPSGTSDDPLLEASAVAMVVGALDRKEQGSATLTFVLFSQLVLLVLFLLQLMRAISTQLSTHGKQQ